MVMQVHLFHQHARYTAIILDEGNLPHPLCPWCNILVPWQSLNRRHLATAQCAKGAERKRQHMAEKEIRDSAERSFQANVRTLEMVTSFK